MRAILMVVIDNAELYVSVSIRNRNWLDADLELEHNVY